MVTVAVLPVNVLLGMRMMFGGLGFLMMPVTLTGVLTSIAVDPSPNWPAPLLPQHLIVPPVNNAQECRDPLAICVAVEIPETVDRGPLPLPSCPS